MGEIIELLLNVHILLTGILWIQNKL